MTDRRTAVRIVRLAVVVGLTAVYLDALFQIRAGSFRETGIGDWIDPYFINGLLEHWFQSARHLGDPASPPVYFPVLGTLGYSHGLILYAPFYVLFRLALDPFPAYTFTLIAVIAIGSVSLYACFRRILGLGFIESLVLTACFCTAHNVIGGATAVWSQRASIFLVPPIVLIATSRPVSPAAAAARDAFTGCALVLLYVQDFYTAQFLVWFAALIGIGVVASSGAARRAIADVVRTLARTLGTPPPTAQTPGRPSGYWLVAAALALAWVVIVIVHPFDRTELGPIRVSARDPTRPLWIAALSAAWYVTRRWRLMARARAAVMAVSESDAATWSRRVYRTHASRIHFAATGAAAGVLVFMWIYWRAFLTHSAFSVEDVRRSLHVADLSSTGLARWLLDAQPYGSVRIFAIGAFAATLALFQGIVERRGRLGVLALWSFVVLATTFLLPLSVNGHSLWMAAVRHVPGMAVIRDPERASQVFELVAVAAVAWYVAWQRRVAIRWTVAGVIAGAIIASGPLAAFEYRRDTRVFTHWVEAPIAIDPSCRSFFIKGASPAYMARSGHMWSLYATDATFIAMRHRLPTINGYSAWFPDGWNLANPQESGYMKAVDTWIVDHALGDVCALDIEARTMTPYAPVK